MAASNQPRLIDHYALRELLGRGHFGEVWRVADLVLDQEVALKLMGPNVTLQQALIESRTHNRTANHDRVVRIHTVKMQPPGPYIVMDYLANGSIGKRLNAATVSLVEAVRWTREALDGLTYVHELGIIHRDIKPDNLLLDANERAVITDFGVSEDTVRNLHASRRIYAAHRAPELDTQPSSKQSDIWAVGCTLYRLVTGEYPFLDEQAAAAGLYAPPQALNPQVPRSLSRVIATALEVDPAARYSDAPAMRTALLKAPIHASWTEVPELSAIGAYDASTATGNYQLRLRQRPGGYEVELKRDLGRGFRRLQHSSHATEGRAQQRMRTLLTHLVEGKALS